MKREKDGMKNKQKRNEKGGGERKKNQKRRRRERRREGEKLVLRLYIMCREVKRSGRGESEGLGVTVKNRWPS